MWYSYYIWRYGVNYLKWTHGRYVRFQMGWFLCYYSLITGLGMAVISRSSYRNPQHIRLSGFVSKSCLAPKWSDSERISGDRKGGPILPVLVYGSYIPRRGPCPILVFCFLLRSLLSRARLSAYCSPTSLGDLGSMITKWYTRCGIGLGIGRWTVKREGLILLGGASSKAYRMNIRGGGSRGTLIR